jgi:hypothetical protein
MNELLKKTIKDALISATKKTLEGDFVSAQEILKEVVLPNVPALKADESAFSTKALFLWAAIDEHIAGLPSSDPKLIESLQEELNDDVH